MFSRIELHFVNLLSFIMKDIPLKSLFKIYSSILHCFTIITLKN